MQHLRSVAFRAISIGRLLGLSESQLDDVVPAAKLQDIGLMSVPDAVLDKPTELSLEASHRPYRPARTAEEALAVLRSGAGGQFDPHVVEALAEEISTPDFEGAPVRV